MPQALPSPSSRRAGAPGPRRGSRPLAGCVVLLVHLGEVGLAADTSSRSATRTSVAAFHAEDGAASAASRWRPARLDDLEPGAEPGGVRGAERIDVDADPVADPAGPPAAVAQEDRDRSTRPGPADPRRQLHRSGRDSGARSRPRWRSPSASARAGLMKAALSQVIRVNGLGSSWSQPLLANRPSQIVGSGRKTSSSPLGGPVAARRGPGRPGPWASTALALRAVPAITPLRRALPPGRLEVARQRLPPPVVADDLQRRSVGLAQQDARAARWPTCRRRAARSAAAGSSPCRRTPRTSPHDSRAWASGMCQWQSPAVSSWWRPRWISSADLGGAQQLGELQVGRGVVGRVDAQDEQRVDATGVDVVGQLARASRAGRPAPAIDRGMILDRLADVAQRVIHQRAPARGPPAAGTRRRSTRHRPFDRAQVARQGRDPVGVARRGGRAASAAMPRRRRPGRSRGRSGRRRGPRRPAGDRPRRR